LRKNVMYLITFRSLDIDNPDLGRCTVRNGDDLDEIYGRISVTFSSTETVFISLFINTSVANTAAWFVCSGHYV